MLRDLIYAKVIMVMVLDIFFRLLDHGQPVITRLALFVLFNPLLNSLFRRCYELIQRRRLLKPMQQLLNRTGCSQIQILELSVQRDHYRHH
ncbi:hypothetical protein D3C78_1097220 [compost metagenome]